MKIARATPEDINALDAAIKETERRLKNAQEKTN